MGSDQSDEDFDFSEVEDLSIEEAVKRLKENVLQRLEGKVPDFLLDELRTRIQALEELVIDRRAPRLMLVGRTSCGKSSLINCMFKEPVAKMGDKPIHGRGQWHTYEGRQGALDILDTRGVGEGIDPELDHDAETGEDEIINEIEDKMPDAILFLCKATEVASRVDEDLESLATVREAVQDEYDMTPPLIGVVTKVDELDPIDVTNPPYDDEAKQENIADKVSILEEKLQEKFGQDVSAVPTSTYIRFDGEDITAERIWNVDTLLDTVFETLPDEAKMEMGRLVKAQKIQKEIAQILVNRSSGGAGLIGFAPMPVADIIPLTSLQIGMVMGIAYIGGYDMDRSNAKEFIGAITGNMLAGQGFRMAARALVQFVPWGGQVISATMAYSGTQSIGRAAIAYFLDNKSAEESQKVYQHWKDKDPDDETMQELKALSEEAEVT